MPEGRSRLMDLLKRCMVRAAKSDLLRIPPLHHKVQKTLSGTRFLCSSLQARVLKRITLVYNSTRSWRGNRNRLGSLSDASEG